MLRPKIGMSSAACEVCSETKRSSGSYISVVVGDILYRESGLPHFKG